MNDKLPPLFHVDVITYSSLNPDAGLGNLLTHPRPLVPQICINELSHYWFRQWLVACSAPSHYLNQCCLIVDWTPENPSWLCLIKWFQACQYEGQSFCTGIYRCPILYPRNSNSNSKNSNSKKVYCHKYIDIHNIYIQVYSDSEGNEADAYLSLYGEWDQLITLVMAYSLLYKLSTTRVVLLNRYTHMCSHIVLKIEHNYRWLVSRPCHLYSFCSTDVKVYARTLILI